MSTTAKTFAPVSAWSFTAAFIHANVATARQGGQYALAWDTPQMKTGLLAMHALFEKAVRGTPESARRGEAFRGLVGLRNMMAPGSIGAFDHFRGQLLQRTATVVEIDDFHSGSRHYNFRINRVNALADLAQASPELLGLTEQALRAFTNNPELDLAGEVEAYRASRDRPAWDRTGAARAL